LHYSLASLTPPPKKFLDIRTQRFCDALKHLD
jgi:hypothetical protein